MGADRILFEPYTFADYASVRSAMTQVGNDVVITLGPTEAVTILGVTIASLTSDKFFFS